MQFLMDFFLVYTPVLLVRCTCLFSMQTRSFSRPAMHGEVHCGRREKKKGIFSLVTIPCSHEYYASSISRDVPSLHLARCVCVFFFSIFRSWEKSFSQVFISPLNAHVDSRWTLHSILRPRFCVCADLDAFFPCNFSTDSENFFFPLFSRSYSL